MAENIISSNPKVDKKVQELTDKNMFLVETKIDSCESSAYDGGDKVYKIKGTAMPLDEVSRNQARYNSQRVKEIVDTMIEKPILINHDWDMVSIGMVTNAYVDDEDNVMRYEGEIDDHVIAKKIERGYIKNVSIGGLVDYINFETEDEIPEVYLSEFVELSFATIPGFQNASTMLAESYRKMKKENQSEETPAQEQDTTIEDRVADIEKQLSEMSSQHEEILNRLINVETRLESLEESEESSEDDDDDEEDDEEKKNDDDDKEESLTRKGVPSAGAENKTIDLREVSLSKKGY